MQSGQYNFSTLSKKGKRSTHENHLLKGVVAWRFLNSRASALDGAAELPGEPHATVPPHPDTVASPPLYLHRSSGLKYNIHGGKESYLPCIRFAINAISSSWPRRTQRSQTCKLGVGNGAAHGSIRLKLFWHAPEFARRRRGTTDMGLTALGIPTCTCSTNDEANMVDKDQINRPPVLFNGNELWRRIQHPVSMRVFLGLHAG